jgi:formate-dependent nitrite reductase membrane component NrfD
MAREDPTYYERPAIKEPVWIWAVPAYFFAGGAAGAAAALGAVAQIRDRHGLEGLIRRCRWISAAGTAGGSGLLVYDLGRPARFLNMLRVFRPTSPLNLGSWLLTTTTPLAGTSALLADRYDGVGAIGDAAGLTAGALGLPLAGYTAVLLSNTAVPVWLGVRRSLPALFSASAVSSAASLLEAMDLSERESAIVRRFGIAGKTAELAAATAVEREASRVKRVGSSLSEGTAGTLWRAGKLLTAASLGITVLGRSRRAKLAAAALGTAGAIAIRFAIFHAGKASARDPRATFHQQRESEVAERRH